MTSGDSRAKYLVIVPTYNEVENIESLISKAMEALPKAHMLIVEDNSPDGTADVVKSLMEGKFNERLFIHERGGKEGLGTAYLFGFGWAIERNYDYIFEMDADFSHNPRSLPSLLKACEEDGFDMAIGSRYVNGVNVVNWPMGRVLMRYYASAYVRTVTGMPIRDTTAGFKCYKKEVLEKVLSQPIKFVGYAFQIEMKFKAWVKNFRLKEIPVVFTDRTRGVSKMNRSIISEAIFGKVRSL